MSHHADFTSADKSTPWDEHWTYHCVAVAAHPRTETLLYQRPAAVDALAVTRGVRFTVLRVTPMTSNGGVRGARLAKRYAHVTDEDLTTQAAHIGAVKR